MKTDKNILLAFVLNLIFSILEFIGGSLTNSVAIISDSIHDIGDSLSIGLSYILEKKSKKRPDQKYTYGYIRYSAVGSVITTSILLVGSILVIYKAIIRIINPVHVNYDGMIVLALIGIVVNFLAAYFTRKGESLNQKSVNLHMFEDFLGWIVVLIGAIIMNFTNVSIIDPILSILVALFIFMNALKNFKEIIDLFLEKVPNGINVTNIKKHLLKINNIIDIYHIHIWSIDGVNNCATMHVVINKKDEEIKKQIRDELKKHGINHVTIELEKQNELCTQSECYIDGMSNNFYHHNHKKNTKND